MPRGGRSLSRLASDLSLNSIAKDGCLEWGGSVNNSGYGKFFSTLLGESSAHRVAYRVAFGDIPDGMYVCHRCDNRRCVKPEHLFLSSHLGNMRDMADKGRAHRFLGSSNPQAKLSSDQIKAIRDDARKQSLIAVDYGVSQSQVSRIKTHARWA